MANKDAMHILLHSFRFRRAYGYCFSSHWPRLDALEAALEASLAAAF